MMIWTRFCKRSVSSSGQSLLETALLLPLILLVVFNAINFGYYFVVALNLATAPRSGVQYAAQGGLSIGNVGLPAPGPSTDNASVSYLTYQDMSKLTGSATTAVRVCTQVNGLTNAGLTTQTANCTLYGNAPSPALTGPASDPESPNFVLQRVDVQYTVTPLIQGMTLKVGGINLPLVTPNLTFHRQVSMRSIN
jgi:Flp pilus assembly protein TadG